MTVQRNTVSASNTGLIINAAVTGLIENNRFQNAALGVRYAAAALLNNNDITNNSVGVAVLVTSTSTGFGAVPGSVANRITGNSLGSIWPAGCNPKSSKTTQQVYLV